MYLVFIWFMPCSLIKKLPHSSCFLPHVEVAPGIVVSALLISCSVRDFTVSVRTFRVENESSRVVSIFS